MSNLLKLLLLHSHWSYLLDLALKVEAAKAAIQAATPGETLSDIANVDASIAGKHGTLILDFKAK